MRDFYVTRSMRIIFACLLGVAVAGGFYFIGLDTFHTEPYWYLFWNLLLAWIPLGLALLVERILKTAVWSSWRALFATFMWAVFFPNALYIITDLYHLNEFAPEDIMYNTAMFFIVVLVGVVVGFISMHIIHKELLKRFHTYTAGCIVAVMLFLTGFAIHLGHDLRWNTWDIISRPASLLFDISELIIHPSQHPQAYITTCTFFAIFSTTYYILWQFARNMGPAPPAEHRK